MQLCGGSWRLHEELRPSIFLSEDDFLHSSSYRKSSETNDFLVGALTDGNISNLMFVEAELNAEVYSALNFIPEFLQSVKSEKCDIDKNLSELVEGFEKFRVIVRDAHDNCRSDGWRSRFGNIEAIKVHSISMSIRSILQGKIISAVIEKWKRTQQIIERDSASMTKLEDKLAVYRERIRALNLKNAELQEHMEE